MSKFVGAFEPRAYISNEQERYAASGIFNGHENMTLERWALH